LSSDGFEIAKGEIPVVLHVPHSSRVIPSQIRNKILLNDSQLQAELDEMTDTHTDLLASSAIAGLDKKPWVFKPLIDEFFHPYAKAFTNLISNLLAEYEYALIIDVHSYRVKQHPNAINHGQARPAICLGTDSFHTPDWLSQLATKHFLPIGEVIEDQPYAGSYVPLDYYGKDPRVLSIMLECRADQLVDQYLKPHSGLAQVAQGLHALISSSWKQLSDAGRPK